MSLVNVKITREINEHVPCQNHTLFQTHKILKNYLKDYSIYKCVKLLEAAPRTDGGWGRGLEVSCTPECDCGWRRGEEGLEAAPQSVMVVVGGAGGLELRGT